MFVLCGGVCGFEVCSLHHSGGADTEKAEMCVCVWVCEKKSVHVCVCVCEKKSVHLCVCVCVCSIYTESISQKIAYFKEVF